MAVTPATPPDAKKNEGNLYSFEQSDGHGHHRDTEAARAQLRVLWARLNGDEEQLAAVERGDPEAWQFMLRYATDGPLSIQWYDNRRPQLELKQRRYNALVMSIVLVVFGLAFLLPFQPLLVVMLEDKLSLGDTAPSTGLVDVAALLGVLASGTTIALRLSAVGVRFRQQAAVFHKASAVLKEQLYGLETEWRHKNLVARDGDTIRLHPDLDEAIRRAVSQARAVMADERDAFFDTLIMDVNALTDGANSVTEALGSRAVVRADTRSNYAQRGRELEDQASQARLEVKTIRAKIRFLEREVERVASKPEEGDIVDLRRQVLDQNLLLQEAEQRQHMLETQHSALRG